MRKALPSLGAGAAALALLVGCAGAPGGLRPGGPSSPAPDGPAPIAGTTEVELIDLWRVSGAEGESADTWLRLDEREFQLWRDCGVVFGSWRVQSDLLIADVVATSGNCAAAGFPDIPWISATAGYSVTAAGFDLVDGNGEVVASLSIDGGPEQRDDLAGFYAEPPETTDEVRQWLAAPDALPDRLAPVRNDDLVGRWAPTGPAAVTDAHVEFGADGRWTGSDGCNGGEGRWLIGDDGLILTTSGASTLMHCEGAAVPHWVAQAARAGIDAGALVLLAVDGEELGRVTRA